jgi:serine/threonine-protein kinase
VSAWNEASCIGRTTARALLLAEELGHRTIAFPALGTGAARVTVETCACAMMAALAWHVAMGGSRLREVQFILGDEAKLRAFREVADAVLREGEELPTVVDLGLPVDGGDVKVYGATMVDARSHSRSPSR